MKTKVKSYALLLAVALFFASLFGLGGVLRVYGEQLQPYEDYEFPEYASDADYVANPDPNLTKLYYISDYEGSVDCYNNGLLYYYINSYPEITDSELFLYRTDFWSRAYNLVFGEEIQNAFIIFEVRNSLPYEIGVFNGTETEYEIGDRYYSDEFWQYKFLEEAFCYLKGNGCKIMFINGTDEVWFQDYYDLFLDYVDIHINLDFLTMFTYSVACEIVEKSGGTEACIVLDKTLSQDWYFRDFFIRYLVFAVNEYGGNLRYQQPVNVLDALHFTVYFYDNETGCYFDIFGNFVGDWNVVETFSAASFSCVIADAPSLACEDLLVLLSDHSNAEFYSCNVYWDEVSDDEISSDIKYFGVSESDIQYYLSVIMRDFILNDLPSLQKYDNWEGRCKVTFRLIWGKGGWARLFNKFTVLADPIDPL